MLHQVGVSFDLYYDAWKHKIKKKKYNSPFVGLGSWGVRGAMSKHFVVKAVYGNGDGLDV